MIGDHAPKQAGQCTRHCTQYFIQNVIIGREQGIEYDSVYVAHLDDTTLV